MGLPKILCKYIDLMYEYSCITVRTKRGESRPKKTFRGFKQGGRFSTTAAKLCLMELIGVIRPLFAGADAGSWIGDVTDMEYGDDEMLLAASRQEAKAIAEKITCEATKRGMGFQGKKVAARVFGKGRPRCEINIGSDKFRFAVGPVLYLGCLFSPDLRWDAHISRRAALLLKTVGHMNR